jgi:hypothetical protein
MKTFKITVRCTDHQEYSHYEEAETTWTAEEYVDHLRDAITTGAQHVQVQDTIYFVDKIIRINVKDLS